MQEEGDRGCGGVAKTSAPGTMVGQVKECGAQLLEHLHTLSQEALDHADLQVWPSSKLLPIFLTKFAQKGSTPAACMQAKVVYKELFRPCWQSIFKQNFQVGQCTRSYVQI